MLLLAVCDDFSLRINGNNWDIIINLGRQFVMVTARMTPCVHSAIYLITQSRRWIYLFEKTSQFIDFIDMAMISYINKLNTSLVEIFTGESRCESPCSRLAPWLVWRLGHECWLTSRLVNEYGMIKSWLGSRLKNHDLRSLVNMAPGHTHNKYPIAHTWGWVMGCIFRI